jgi:hypothetical protein
MYGGIVCRRAKSHLAICLENEITRGFIKNFKLERALKACLFVFHPYVRSCHLLYQRSVQLIHYLQGGTHLAKCTRRRVIFSSVRISFVSVMRVPNASERGAVLPARLILGGLSLGTFYYES